MTAPDPRFHINAQRMQNWIKLHPGLSSLRVAMCDFNGCFRGKRLPVADADKAISGGIRMPLTLVAQDIWGRDIVGNPVFDAGDADGLCLPTGRGPLPVDWLARPTALLPMWSFTGSGAPNPVDPRHALARVLARAAAAGLKPVVGTELEFHLVDSTNLRPSPPISPVSGRPLAADGVLALDDIDGFEAFFDDLYRAAGESGIAAEAAIAEGSPGQFEVTLRHGDDAMRAADDTLLMKRLVRGTARKHRLAASFMAKPYADASGNGMHVHMSLLDAQGRNIFDDGTRSGTPELGFAVAGCLEALLPMTLVFAPHLNSYRRLKPGGHAPAGVGWAYENRFAAVRIPGGSGKARRFEHRVAGADANPYLVIAAVIAAALDGIEARKAPPPPLKGNAFDQDLPMLPGSWEQAIAAFRESDIPARTFPPQLAELFADAKAQEWDRFQSQMSDFELQSYLEVV